VTQAANPSPGWRLGAAQGWTLGERAGWRLAVKGHLIDGMRTLQGEAFLDHLAPLLSAGGLGEALAARDGHFALLAERNGVSLAAVDRIASYPLFVSTAGDSVGQVSDHPALLTVAPLAEALDQDSARVLALSGFTNGCATLHRAVRRLAPGELWVRESGGMQTGRRWHQYRPWQSVARSDAQRRKDLKDLLWHLFERLAEGCAGRPIVVPLSAGLDSRLIVSGLHAVGARDVRCFSYGQPGNHEAIASQQIAQRLGYDWTFVPYTLATQRAALTSTLHDAYTAFADSLSATPFEQDFLAVRTLRDRGWLPADCVMINGQSGDYITGGHIPAALAQPLRGQDADQRFAAVFAPLVAKHYSLWQSLQSDELLALVAAQVGDHLTACGLPEVPVEMPHAAFELSEFENRQCKYVVPGQRVYDFFEIDWRLPLWEGAFIAFWQGVPAADKLKQKLYREVLTDANWGGVWQGYKTPPQKVVPAWLRLPRLAAKLAAAPLGRQRWHRLEKRLFAYRMDVVLNMAFLPYGRVAKDTRGARNAISWITERYLNGHGLDWRGQPFDTEDAR
jgi:asparagine synthase (glutamine-hydrolysing)